jgi:hypothetical protein
MVKILISPPVPLIKSRVRHCGCIKHCMEALDLCIYLFTVLRQHRSQLVEDHPGCYGIAGRHVVDMLILTLDPAYFLVERPRVVLESLSSCRALPVVLGVMPPRGATILSLILLCSRVIL